MGSTFGNIQLYSAAASLRLNEDAFLEGLAPGWRRVEKHPDFIFNTTGKPYCYTYHYIKCLNAGSCSERSGTLSQRSRAVHSWCPKIPRAGCPVRDHQSFCSWPGFFHAEDYVFTIRFISSCNWAPPEVKAETSTRIPALKHRLSHTLSTLVK